MPQRGQERPGGHGIPGFLETGTSGMPISRGSKPSKPHISGGSPSENQTAGEDRVRKRTTALWEDQSPEGRKLRSVAGVKETRQGNRGGLRQDRPAGSVEMHRVGSGRGLATSPFQALVTIRWRAGKAQGGCVSRRHPRVRAKHGAAPVNTLKGRASPGEALRLAIANSRHEGCGRPGSRRTACRENLSQNGSTRLRCTLKGT